MRHWGIVTHKVSFLPACTSLSLELPFNLTPSFSFPSPPHLPVSLTPASTFLFLSSTPSYPSYYCQHLPIPLPNTFMSVFLLPSLLFSSPIHLPVSLNLPFRLPYIFLFAFILPISSSPTPLQLPGIFLSLSSALYV